MFAGRKGNMLMLPSGSMSSTWQWMMTDKLTSLVTSYTSLSVISQFSGARWNFDCRVELLEACFFYI
jgi:hypothetical protein